MFKQRLGQSGYGLIAFQCPPPFLCLLPSTHFAPTTVSPWERGSAPAFSSPTHCSLTPKELRISPTSRQGHGSRGITVPFRGAVTGPIKVTGASHWWGQAGPGSWDFISVCLFSSSGKQFNRALLSPQHCWFWTDRRVGLGHCQKCEESFCVLKLLTSSGTPLLQNCTQVPPTIKECTGTGRVSEGDLTSWKFL